MRGRGYVRAALASVAAVAGTGFASGRALVLFFAQTGRVSWVGVATAAATFGLLTGLLCGCAARFGAGSFPRLCRRALGRGAGLAARVMHALLLALAAGLMLSSAGEIGALTLPLENGRLCGAGLALLLAFVATLWKQRPLPWAGLAALVVGVAFYAALALDPRPVRTYLNGEVQLALSGSVPAAILLGLAYGAMDACLAAGVAIRFGADCKRPARLGALCGGLLGALLACANAALLRGGDKLCAQLLPTVLLSARWGLTGFWLCAVYGFLCAAATLSAAVGGLIENLRCNDAVPYLRGGIGGAESL